MLDGLKQSAALAAKKTAYSAAGGIFLAVGVGFLTSAAWIYLSLEHGALVASLLIGAAYTGLGFIFLAISSLSGAKHTPARALHEPPPKPEANMPGLMQAFFHGMDAGAKAKGNR